MLKHIYKEEDDHIFSALWACSSPPNMGKVKDILADDWPSNMLKKTEVCKERRWWRLRWELKGKVEAPLTWARGNFQSEATKFFEKGLIWWNYHSTLYLPICIWIIFTKIFKQAPQAEGCTFDLLIYWLSTGVFSPLLTLQWLLLTPSDFWPPKICWLD